jgi:hypothetical protein
MAIRQIVSRSIKDGEVAGSDMATGAAAGYFQGDNGVQGNSSNGKKDIFRINESQLDNNTTIASGDNASCTGPLTIASNKTLTVNGTLAII